MEVKANLGSHIERLYKRKVCRVDTIDLNGNRGA
jgi:hypothetical protein